MLILQRLFHFFRNIRPRVWRHLLSPVSSYWLEVTQSLDFDERPLLVGWPIIRSTGKISIGKNCVLVSLPNGNPLGLYRPCMLETLNPDSRIVIGDDFSASGVCVVAATSVIIGRGVSVGANATIVDTDFHALLPAERKLQQPARSSPVLIEDDVWIGMNALIMKGVTIRRAAIVGANAVVTKNVRAGAVVAGNPAREIRSEISGKN